jgi:vacuolar-type H+-ATPase subunit I/STV1
MDILLQPNVYVVSVLVFIALIVAQQLSHGRTVARMRLTRDDAQANAKEARIELMEALSTAEKRVKEAEEAVEASRGTLQAAEALAMKQQRRADEQFGVIEDIGRERDQIWRRYREMCASAGHAQDVLFTELERILKMYNARALKYGFEPFKMRTDLLSALRQFTKLHGKDDEVTRQEVRAEAEKARPAPRPEPK